MHNRHSDYYSSKVLKRAALHKDITRYTHGACHTLAYALWLANDRRGKLLACMVSTYEPNGVISCISYGHMIYEDANGTAWDYEGAQADTRYEEARAQEHEMEMQALEWEHNNYQSEQDEDEFDEAFEPDTIQLNWIEVHPTNLFAFLTQWNATHPIEQREIEDLTQDSIIEKGLINKNKVPPSQIDIFGQEFSATDHSKAPYTEEWYSKMKADGWSFAEKAQDMTGCRTSEPS
jgi:hypothetical protein